VREALKYITKKVCMYTVYGLPIMAIVALFDIFFMKRSLLYVILEIASLILGLFVACVIMYIAYKHENLPLP
jgi:hypothetical protein